MKKMAKKPYEYQVWVQRDKESTCNICGVHGPLTWDHVPPQGSIELSAVDQRNLLHHSTGPQDMHDKATISQNGVKFRTLCKKCNSMLGSEYDPALIEFSRGIGAYLTTGNALPDRVHYGVKPNRLARAILGHLLAAKFEYERSTVDEAMRRYVLDPRGEFPSGLRLLYFVYPYQNIIVVRDCLMPAQRGKFSGWGLFSILKFFPLAYLVTSLPSYEGLPDLSMHTSSTIEASADVLVVMEVDRHPEWPEVIEPANMVIFGQPLLSSIHATPRK